MSNIQEIDFSVDLLRSLLWQHNNAPKLTALIVGENDWYRTNGQEFWEAWVRNVFDLRTANEFGLKVWAIILDIPLNTVIVGSGGKRWGFGTYNQNYDRAPFAVVGNNSAAISMEDARLILRLRYFQLICRPTVPEINRFLKYIFANRGNVYVQDTNDMKYVVYTFDFAPGVSLVELLKYFDVLPRPAGVGMRVLVEGTEVFGFGETNVNYNRAPFAMEQ